MLELGERGARNGPEDVGEGLVGPNAAGGGAQSQPDPPAAALEGAGQRAIVNQRVADGCDAADALQRLAANEHAVAGGSGRGAPPIRDPGGWIEHEEKEDKRGNHGALRESAALERRHVGYQRVVAGFGARRERGGVAWRMRGIGVGQKQIVGPQARGFADTLREGPDFARPAGLEGLGPNHGKEFGRGGGAGGFEGAVGTGIVHQDDVERSGVAVSGERCDGPAHHVRFIARRNHGDDGRRRRRQCAFRRSVAKAPKAAAAEQQVEPYGNRGDGEDFRNHESRLSPGKAAPRRARGYTGRQSCESGSRFGPAPWWPWRAARPDRKSVV